MPSGSWWYTGWVWLPEMLIVGLADGYALPSTANDVTSFTDKILCGTTSDLVVGTSQTTTALSLTSGSGGAHSSGSPTSILTEHSIEPISGSCPGGCADRSWNGISYGAHTHSLTGTYTPKKNKLRFIRISQYSPPSIGMILFGDSDSVHEPFTTFNGNSGFLTAGAATSVVNEVRSLTLGSGTLTSHGHHTSVDTRPASGVLSDKDSLLTAGGGAHSDHSLSTLVITPAMKAAAVRAYKLVSRTNCGGLIGIWDQTGPIPPQWSLVASFDGYHLKFAAGATGTLTGNDTLAISGETGGSAHAHNPYAPYSGGALVGLGYHTSLSHTHAVSGSPAYRPDRYFVKFIRYEG